VLKLSKYFLHFAHSFLDFNLSFDLDFVQDVSRDLNFEYALSNSFGFGGGNAALIFKKFKK